MLITLEGLADPIEFDGGAEALVPVLERVLFGWRVKKAAVAKAVPKIRLTAGPQGYERRSPWIEAGHMAVYLDPVDAVCDMLLDVERAYVEDAPKRGQALSMILHAAAVEMTPGPDSRLVVFPSTHATGKSLLTAALAHAGHRVFADDQVPLIPGTPATGIAPGFLPRLRRPLPDGLDGDLAGFIRGHEGPVSAKFRYIDLDQGRLAPLGTCAPITGLVLLARADGAEPVLEPASEAEVLKSCVLQSFGRAMTAIEVLDHLHAMVQGAKCVKLRYADAPQAVRLLEEAFA